MILHLILVSLACWNVDSAEPCLPDAIPATSRRSIADEVGTPTPIRIGAFSWNLAVQLSVLLDLIISEKLGYDTAPVEFLGFPSFQGLVLKLAGCATAACNDTVDGVHIIVDAFPGDAETLELFRSEHPERVPENLGGMGYTFSWGIYLKGSVRDEAFREAALPLEYYRNYNSSIHRPHRFFDGLSDLDMEDFILCNDSTTYGDDFTNGPVWSNYVHWTGDIDGVIETSDGYAAKCPDGRFWLSPACRSNTSECIPVLSAFATLANMLHWATAHNLPFAIGRPPNFVRYQELLRKYDILHYWWEPDEGELTDLRVSRLVLPPHNALEYADGNLRTAAVGTQLNKYGSSLLARFAPRVRGLVQRVATSEQTILSLANSISLPTGDGQQLGDVFFTNQGEARKQMCEWAKSNRDIWEEWLPIETNCILGFGLVNEQDEPVDSRERAVTCSLCPAGRFSQFMVDPVGHTHRCAQCPPGTHQNTRGKASCEACDPGMFARSPGQDLCSPCPRGSFADALGASSCLSCGNGTERTTTALVEDEWMEIQGAKSASNCRCRPGSFLQNDQCILCGVGTTCPGSNSLQVLPGFHCKSDEPGLVYKCFGIAERCPGGLPGSCAAGRDASSPGCSECLFGLQPGGAECRGCSGGDYFRLVAYGLLVIAATAALHVLFFVGGHGNNRLQSKLVTAALCWSQLITFAQFFAVMRQIQAVNWADPFLSFLQFFDVFSLQTILSSLSSISCFTRLTPEASFLTRTLLVPAFFAVGPSISHAGFVFAARRRSSQEAPKIGWLFGTLGSLCLLFFIMMCFICLEPFRCNVHPNGLATMQTEHGVFCDLTGQHLSLCMVGGVILLIPLGFLALSTWIIHKELPRRVAKGDTEFVQTTSFLTMRFKPGYEGFTVVFLLRNLLLPVTPMFTSTPVSLLVMGSLLTTSVAVVAYWQPWRTLLSTQVDVFGHVVLLMVLLLSALSVPDHDDPWVMIFCTIMAFLLVMVILFAAVCSLVQYVKSRLRKPFCFFMCHHKATTASLARWLKMELRGRGANFTTFLDLDSLTDLTQLFNYVSTQVQNFVILGSAGIVARKWCLGEMTTARLSKVESVLASLPDFNLPEESFIREISTIVPDILDLTTYGYGLSEVKASLRWLASLKTIAVERISAASICGLVTELTHSGNNSVSDMALTSAGACVVVDHENAEALASAHVLTRFLAPIMMDRGTPVLVLSPENPEIRLEQIQPTSIVLICSENCFASQFVKKCVLKARFLLSCSVLPVVLDEGFVVHGSPPTSAADEDGGAYRSVLAAVFLEVALPFPTRTSSEDDLFVRASHIGRRLSPGSLKTLRSKLWMTSKAPESNGVDSNLYEDGWPSPHEGEMVSHAF
ncbi:SCUBE3 [Symbiodinium sp. CCMP2592]|nr:SCUBE3 [Symbiodinium sp. CCMP2592]